MNETCAQIIFLSGGTAALWCLKELMFPKMDHPRKANSKEKRVIAAQDICHRWQPVAKEPGNPLGRGLEVAAEEQTVAAAGLCKYEKDAIKVFWVSYCASLQEPYRSIIRDVLCEYDKMEHRAPSESLLKQKGKSLSYDNFLTLQLVPLWCHAIHTAEEFISAVPTEERRGPFICLGFIACLAHDIAKRPYDPRNYSATCHAQQSADLMKGIVMDRLHAENESDLLTAIRAHHDKRHKEMTPLTHLLKTAHARATYRELHEASIICQVTEP